MALIRLIDVCKAYEHQQILQQISLSIKEGERIAIVGKNGSGKSTLLKLIAGECQGESGERILQGKPIISYLPQIPQFENLSVYEAIELSLDELKRAHMRIKEIEVALEKAEEKGLLEEYAQLSSYLEAQNAWDLEAKVQEVIEHFDLGKLINRNLYSLSGGEQKRVALSMILFKQCQVLLLDEPTNHLDVEMVEFLEQKLLALKCSIVFISHDRYFIDHLATRVVEVENAKLLSFDGGYQRYLKQKEALLHSLSREHEVLLKLLKNEEEWLRRGVKARLKRNEGRKKRILEMRQQAKNNPSVIHKMRLELERERKPFNQIEGKNHKKILFEAQNLSCALGERVLFGPLDFIISQRDKIAIVGKNGSGKSTFLKVLLKEIAPQNGTLKCAEMRVGYFDQHRKLLDESKTILELFCPHGGDRVEVRGKSMHVYGYLKNFLFPKEFLTHRIFELSGGEKNRLALALLFTQEYDCLILDEPTNDLDIPTINILEEYLHHFEGCLLFVSHDRYFVDKIAHKLFVFEGEGRVIERYESYSEILEEKEELLEYARIEQAAQKERREKRNKPPTKLSYKDQRMFESLPAEIEALEKEITQFQTQLSDPKLYAQKGVVEIAEALKRCQDLHEQKLELYFDLMQKSESMGS